MGELVPESYLSRARGAPGVPDSSPSVPATPRCAELPQFLDLNVRHAACSGPVRPPRQGALRRKENGHEHAFEHHEQHRKVVYVINERNGKSYWTRIGFGSVNKDGSMNLRFDAIPVGGSTVQVRDWEPRDESKFGGTVGEATSRAAFA